MEEAIVREANGKRKKAIMAVASAIGLIVIFGGFIWWNTLRTTVSTDNAKVTGDLVDISSKVAGRLDTICVEEGQTVTRGQVLAKLDDSQYRITLNQAKAALDMARANYGQLPDLTKSANVGVQKAASGVAAAEAQVKSAQTGLDDARRALSHARELFAAGAISQNELLAAQSAYERAAAVVEAAQANLQAAQGTLVDAQTKVDATTGAQAAVYQAQVEQAQAAYDNARLAEDNTTITAGVSGTVLRIPVATGENISAGQTIMTISNLSRVWVTANIDENKIGRIRVGQKVDVSIDSYPGRRFQGQVTEVGDATQSTFALIPTDSTSGNFTKVTQRVPVKISVQSGGLALRPGMSATVKIHTR